MSGADVIRVGQILGVFLSDGTLAAVALVRTFDDAAQPSRQPRVFHAAWNLIDGTDLDLEPSVNP